MKKGKVFFIVTVVFATLFWIGIIENVINRPTIVNEEDMVVIDSYDICQNGVYPENPDCNGEIWKVEVVEDGSLGYSKYSGNKIIGVTKQIKHKILIEESKVYRVDYEDSLGIEMSTFEHEVEHMKCRCNFHILEDLEQKKKYYENLILNGDD